MSNINWAKARQIEQDDICKDSDQPGHPPHVIQVVAMNFVGSYGLDSEDWSDWVDA